MGILRLEIFFQPFSFNWSTDKFNCQKYMAIIKASSLLGLFYNLLSFILL